MSLETIGGAFRVTALASIQNTRLQEAPELYEIFNMVGCPESTLRPPGIWHLLSALPLLLAEGDHFQHILRLGPRERAVAVG